MATLLPPTTIAAAVSPAVVAGPWQFRDGVPRNLTLEAIFLYGAGGTSVDGYIQTSLDGGDTWIDIANFHFTTAAGKKIYNLSSGTPVTTAVTPTDGTIADNTSIDGIIGPMVRVKYKSAGTYTGASSLALFANGARIVSIAP